MLRTIVISISLAITYGIVPECTRPVINHWLGDDSLRNESFSLYGDHPAQKKEIFFTLVHSECITSTGGKTRLFCNGYSFSLDCQKGDNTFKPHEILMGLGKHSVIWNHYKRMVLTDDSITFGDKSLEIDQEYGIKLQCIRQGGEGDPSLCTHSNGEVIFGAHDQLTEDVNIQMFSDTLSTVVPPDLYASIISGNNIFHYKAKHDADVVRCGENCIWISDIWKDNGNSVRRGTNNNLVLGSLARHQLKISYDATEHYVHIIPSVHVSKYTKLTSQIILIGKLGILCFLGTTTSVRKYNVNTEKFISTISVFVGLEILLFAHSVIFQITGLAQVALLLALNMVYTDKYGMGGRPQAIILALVIIQSTLIELSFFELSILALMAHSIIVFSTVIKLLLSGAKKIALVFAGMVVISVLLQLDVLSVDINEFTCLFGLSSSTLLYIFFTEISLALSLEWVVREKSA